MIARNKVFASCSHELHEVAQTVTSQWIVVASYENVMSKGDTDIGKRLSIWVVPGYYHTWQHL
jgi:hypothetical protein